MKILITGAVGQLGSTLVSFLTAAHEVVPLSRAELDITIPNKVKETILIHRPDVIIHTAAYTDVDLSEKHADTAFQINAFGTRNIAEAAELVGAKLVHISSDYVFDGMKKEPYIESDCPSPINIYGSTKLLGEKFVELYCSKHFIVRTAWLYGMGQRSFVNTICKLARSQNEISVVTDCYGSPTYVVDLAAFITELLSKESYGIYHVVNEGVCSRFELAQAIVQEMGFDHVQVLPILSHQFEQSALRPANSALDCAAIRMNGLTPLRDWRSALQAFKRNGA
ncbi:MULTISPECIES: dTDP-4-dehydrorhamnose reductase [unclassified Paenibacillus]|uniref:dTDP-4-dehydrorhamnose reductase n=1 Tax=unclassified Paenibacillus TaxID=185978 RepID=UPI00278B6D5A|nr:MULTISPECIES: dTDP-4-dehydrorhamnose reductase [unclassified Paenibacillus]MDQ0901572.1 dTDP-4-dehydrorhamnose reductase [Paenibacillus sp. V4I7]MDQ0919927.1 dTDP-4-dehydrorhamnose reductase [Paenibacillus sp. V4I5]